MPPDRAPEIKENLHFRADATSTHRLSTDRPNIFFSVRKMEAPQGSFHDLLFVIKEHLAGGNPTKFLVFFNSRAEAQSGAEFLCEHLLPELRDKIKWFHSGMTDEFRDEEMKALVVGDVYGHCATDAAGMVGSYISRFLIHAHP